MSFITEDTEFCESLRQMVDELSGTEFSMPLPAVQQHCLLDKEKPARAQLL